MSTKTQSILSQQDGQRLSGCLVCGNKVSFLGKNSDYVYGCCNSCKTVQLSPVPDQADLEKAYSSSLFAARSHGQGDPDEIRRSSNRYYVSIAEALSDYRVSGKVVDYGAGWGGLCEVLLARGFNCRGVELAENMVQECQSRKLPVEQCTLESLVERGDRLEAIVLCGVFEHIANPRTFLKNAHALIEPNGLIVSLQPTASFAMLLAFLSRLGRKDKPLPSLFWFFDAPWHVALYSLEGMCSLAHECGFELVDIRPAPMGRMPGLYGFIQRLSEWTNKIGWRLFKTKWPLITSHTFVFRRLAESH